MNCSLFIKALILSGWISGSTREMECLPRTIPEGIYAPVSTNHDSSASFADLPKGAKDTTTLSFKDTDLRDIFRALSHQHGINVFLDNSINQRATISLTRVRVVDAVRFLCRQHRLNLDIQGGIFEITPPPPVEIEPPPPKIPVVSYNHQLLSVELKDDELEHVVLELEKKTGFNILRLAGTTGAVTGTLSNIDFETGFTLLMNNNGFAIQRKNGVYIVSRPEYFAGTEQADQPQRSGPYWIGIKDSLVTIDVTNAPLERLLADMIRQCNSDVIFYSALSGTITVRATNIELPKVVDMILRHTIYSYRVSDGSYFIGEKTNKALAVTKLLKLRHLRAEKIFEIIPQSITTQAIVKPISEHNGFVIIGSNDVIDQMTEFIAQVDRPVAQVLIEAIVVDFDLTRGSEFGLQAGVFGKPDSSAVERSGSYVPGIDVEAKGSWLNRQLERIGQVNLFGRDLEISSWGVLPADFYIRLRALEQQGVANVKSRPLIATLNGQQASLSIGTTQYFLLKTTTPYRDQNQVLFQESQNFQTIDADVKLEITPYVGEDSFITVEIKPDFRTPVGQFNANTPPTINRRALSSTLVIKNGETIVLGGLIEETEIETRSQVPILGSIPVIGNLFSSTKKSARKSELIIYVTPHISFGEAFRNLASPSPDE